MKLKFKQSVYLSSLDIMTQNDMELEIENAELAQDLINAGYAETVVEEKPSKKVVEETAEVKPKVKRAPKGDK